MTDCTWCGIRIIRDEDFGLNFCRRYIALGQKRPNQQEPRFDVTRPILQRLSRQPRRDIGPPAGKLQVSQLARSGRSPWVDSDYFIELRGSAFDVLPRCVQLAQNEMRRRKLRVSLYGRFGNYEGLFRLFASGEKLGLNCQRMHGVGRLLEEGIHDLLGLVRLTLRSAQFGQLHSGRRNVRQACIGKNLLGLDELRRRLATIVIGQKNLCFRLRRRLGVGSQIRLGLRSAPRQDEEETEGPIGELILRVYLNRVSDRCFGLR